MLLVPIDCECGTKYGLTAYAAVAVLSVLLVADKETAAVFVFLGYYPVVKNSFDRIRPKVLRIVLKLFVQRFRSRSLRSSDIRLQYDGAC